MLPKNVKYSAEKYQKYNGTDVIFVEKIADIPTDYAGLMAVPLTILYYDFSEYEVCGRAYAEGTYHKPIIGELLLDSNVGNECKFIRIIIRRKTSNINKV